MIHGIWISDFEPFILKVNVRVNVSFWKCAHQTSWEGSDLVADRNSVNCGWIGFWIKLLNIFWTVVLHSPWHLHILRKFQGLKVFWYARSELYFISCTKLYFLALLPKLFMPFALLLLLVVHLFHVNDKCRKQTKLERNYYFTSNKCETFHQYHWTF